MSNETAATGTAGVSARSLGAVAACLLLAGCASGIPGAKPEAEAAGPARAPIVGVTTQDEILARNPEWVDELVRSRPDAARSLRLADPAGGAEVLVLLGTWCSDSRRELTRLWRAVEMAGGDFGFPIRYVGVDRSKTEPSELLEGLDLRYVPTLVVLENGGESGRIVESAPNGIESDLVALLHKEATGVISGREDLEDAPESGARP